MKKRRLAISVALLAGAIMFSKATFNIIGIAAVGGTIAIVIRRRRKEKE